MGSFLRVLNQPVAKAGLMVLVSLATVATVNRVPTLKRVIHSKA